MTFVSCYDATVIMDDVRRILTFGLAWLAAAVLASVVAWQGVSLIGAQVTDSRPDTLSAGQVDAMLAGVTTTVERPGASPATTAPTAATTTPTTRSGSPSGGSVGTPGSGTTPATPTPTPAPPAAPAVTEVIPTTGGTVAFSFSPTAVTPSMIRPNNGYRIDRSEPRDDGGWRVELKSDAGSSRVDAWWAGGPQWRVSDSGGGGGDSGDDD